jgi:hypothetical protein
MNFISCRYIIFLEENFINRYQIHQCNIGLKRFRYCTSSHKSRAQFLCVIITITIYNISIVGETTDNILMLYYVVTSSTILSFSVTENHST